MESMDNFNNDKLIEEKFENMNCKPMCWFNRGNFDT